MPLPEPIGEYIDDVCRQIRWNKAHPRVSRELEGHITDTRDHYLEQGLDEKVATEMAIADTGDAAEIGARLDRIHRPRPQWGMLTATAALVMIGLLIRMFVYNDEDRSGFLSVRLFFTAIGLAAMVGTYLSDFSLIGKFPKAACSLIIAAALTGLHLSPRVNGMSYYTQYIIMLFPLAFAAVIFAVRGKRYAGIGICGAAFIGMCVITLLIPSVSAFLLFVFAGIPLFCVAVCKGWFGVRRLHGLLLLLALLVILAAIFAIINNDYSTVWDRLTIMINPSLDPTGRGYTATMTRELLSGAKLLGRGTIPGAYYRSVIEPSDWIYTDLILTAVTALLGWVFFAVIVCALLFFIVKGFRLCFRQKSVLGLLVSLAVMLTFTVQTTGYVLYNLGMQFVTIISLPLISYGNAATAINLALIGFMLSVFRTGDAVCDETVKHAP